MYAYIYNVYMEYMQRRNFDLESGGSKFCIVKIAK